MLKEVKDPQRFGVPIFEGDRIIGIEEKPKEPKSPYAVTGIYCYDHQVFDIIRTLKPSARGELEITDVNNAYIQRGQMTWDILEGWWTDAGTFESLMLAGTLVSQTGRIGSEGGGVRFIETSLKGIILIEPDVLQDHEEFSWSCTIRTNTPRQAYRPALCRTIFRRQRGGPCGACTISSGSPRESW